MKRSLICTAVLGMAIPATSVFADDHATTKPAGKLDALTGDIVVPDIDYEIETLDNGLTVIYAPLDNAPVVHVRVLYHVGSKDETPDRQGFAHLFEHMMFRGSANVPSEEHMKLINGVGGNSNAFTSFDQTTYINTVPANALEMALWLEADRMASFQVNDEVFATERDVVNEEYNLRVANPPYGRLFLDFFDLAFEESHYSWTPIGDMEQLAQASAQELQEFFDLFYVPNNAVLTIAGDFDVDEAKQWTRDYYGWIPASQDVPRRSPEEPTQSESKRKIVYAPAAPLTQIAMGFKTPKWSDEDNYALQVTALVLGQGRSSRMYRALVAGEDGPPVAAQASSGNQELEDGGLLFATVAVLPGQDPNTVEAKALRVIARFAEEGPTEDELAKAKTQLRLQLLRGRQTADSVATTLAEAQAFGGDVELANTADDKIDALTVADVRRAAQTYLDETRVSILQYRPGTDPNAAADAMETETGPGEDQVQGGQGMDDHGEKTNDFPADYPKTAPVPQDVIDADFSMGESMKVGAMEVIVINDDRIPLIGMNLLLPGGGDTVSPGKLGLAGLTADLMTRGVGELDAAAFSELLESRGINLSAGDGGDHTRLSGSMPKAELATAAKLAGDMLASPALPAGEFANLQRRALAGLQQQLSNPSAVASRQLSETLFGNTPQGRSATLQTMQAITLDDIKQYHRENYNLVDATLILAGDINADEAKIFAETIQSAFSSGEAAMMTEEADYALPTQERQIVLVDNSNGQQSAVRLGGRAFKTDSEDKWAASVATQILSGGIESRLNRSLRAEKGLTYSASGRFGPGRHAGRFTTSFDTRPETTREGIEAAFEVLHRMATEPVTDAELAEAKRRVVGSLVMSTQTVGQQASLRSNITLNGYPIDYYDAYADKISAVTVEEVQRVMQQYATPDQLSIVVVGPASVVQPQLEGMVEGLEVQVEPMPLQR